MDNLYIHLNVNIRENPLYSNSILFCLNFIKSRIFVFLQSMMKHNDYEVKMNINLCCGLQTILQSDSKESNILFSC